MKVLVAIPAYDRKVCVQTAGALLDEQALASLSGVALDIRFIPGTSLITHARNQGVNDFLASDANRLVFVDSDVAWEPGALVRIASHPVDFVGGAYRYKDQVERYPVRWLERAELWSDPETGLIEVASLPAGFLSLSRAVFERLQSAHPEREYAFGGHLFRAFFHCPPGHGEDSSFCDDWRALGGSVWLDPLLTLTHVDGAQTYTGCIGAWLRRNAGLEPVEIAA